MTMMKPLSRTCLCLIAGISPVVAGTVVITTLPDITHPLPPLISLDGFPLIDGTVVKVGAFPGKSDDEVVGIATSGAVDATFVPFGASHAIGDGVTGEDGSFEFSVRQAVPNASAPFGGEEITVLIQKGAGQEILIARFKGKHFEVDPDTGLEPLLSVHLADAKVVVGNYRGGKFMSTTPPPAVGSFSTWIDSYSISDPDLRLPGADADGDGRSNFLEYATGGNPTSSVDVPPCQLVAGASGDPWFRFSSASGIGSAAPRVETSGDLVSPWVKMEALVEVDPDPPSSSPGVDWLRVAVPRPLGQKGFFRLSVESEP